MAHRRVGRDSSAEQRSGARRIQVRRHTQHEMLIDDDAFGISAIRHAPEMLVRKVVGVRGIGAELFEPGAAFRAGAVGVDHAAHGGKIADLELLHRRADFGDAADDLVSGDAWVDRGKKLSPLIADLVQIGMADPAVENVNLDVLFSWISSGNCSSGKRGSRAGSRVRFHGRHGSYFRCSCHIALCKTRHCICRGRQANGVGTEQRAPPRANGSASPVLGLVGKTTRVKHPATDRWQSARSSKSAGAGAAASTGGEGREQPLDFLGIAVRAFQVAVGVSDAAQLLKDVAAATALVFVERHHSILVRNIHCISRIVKHSS